MKELIQKLIDKGYLKSDRIINAFQEIQRKDFVPEKYKDQASKNFPISIGEGQTISQPLTVAFMLELLSPQKGDKVLDIGSGSGWVTALLAHIVGKKGKVFALERIKKLKEFGRENVSKYNFVKSDRVKFYLQSGYKGLEEKAPFDRIHIAAAAYKVPENLIKQLKIGGKMIIPIRKNNDLILITKTKKGIDRKSFHGFTFVPLVKDS